MCFWKFPCLFISLCVYLMNTFCSTGLFICGLTRRWLLLKLYCQDDMNNVNLYRVLINKNGTKIRGNKFIMQSRLIFGKHGENIEQSILPWKVQGFIPNHILSRYVAHVCGSHQKDVKEGGSSQRTRKKGYGGSSKRKKAPSFQPRLSVTRGCRRRSGWGNPLRTRARQVQ